MPVRRPKQWTLRGAYGRDYEWPVEVLIDLVQKQKDFECLSIDARVNTGGRYCSIRDIQPRDEICVVHHKGARRSYFKVIEGKWNLIGMLDGMTERSVHDERIDAQRT